MNPWDSEEGGIGDFIGWMIFAILLFGIVMGVAFTRCGG